MTALCGLLPAAGDTVIIGPTACAAFAGRAPLQAEVVDVTRDEGTLPGFAYITVQPDLADLAEAEADAAKRYFVRVEGLVIHRQP
jgi:hypothetical protein